MKLRVLFALALCLAAAAVQASEEGTGEKKPGMISRVLNIFRGSPGRPDETRAVKWKALRLTMRVEPLPVKVPDTRQLRVTLQLANRGGKLIQLEFPTTQRIEVLVRRADGKLVEQWSEDQSFSDEPTLITINPGERLEYSVPVSTRDMVAGQSYTIEGYFPNFEQLKTSKTIAVEK